MWFSNPAVRLQYPNKRFWFEQMCFNYKRRYGHQKAQRLLRQMKWQHKQIWFNWTSPPHSFRKSVSIPPHWRMHSSTECASCTVRNIMKLLRNITEALRHIMELLWSITEWYRSITEPLLDITEHYRMLQSIAGHYGTFWKHCRSIRRCCGALWNITEHCGMSRNITEALQIVTEHYRSGTEPLQNVTKPLQKTSILSISN